MPSELERTAAAFRRQLLERDRQAARELIWRYSVAWRRIRKETDALLRQISEARAAGEDVRAWWLYREARLDILREQVEREIASYSAAAAQAIRGGEADAVDMALDHSERLARAGLGEPPPGVTVPWTRLNREAVTDLVGFLHDGSPLASLLGELGPEAAKAIGDALVVGVSLGQGPREIARAIRREGGMPLVRALRISRTEVMRSYREASHRSYQANSDVVKGWIWHSALDKRTCMSCVSMHGSFHTNNERLDDHPNGRCSAVPRTKTWAELGIKGARETSPTIEKGADWFARQPEDVQREMMGPAKYAAWKDDQFALKDMVGRSRSKEWGTHRFERSLTDILGEDKAAPYLHSGRSEGAKQAAVTRAANAERERQKAEREARRKEQRRKPRE
ncbi:MAG: phage minor head protein [Phycisphaerales bacterium]|jgi:SPP1 gp7 family putative phage head morphogenesis protein